MVALQLYDRGIRVVLVPPVPIGGEPRPPIIVNPIPPPGGGAPAVPQIAVRFTVTKALSPEPHRATVSMWQLAQTTRDAIAGVTRRTSTWAPPVPLLKVDGRLIAGDPLITASAAGFGYLRLSAGYGAALATIFEGPATKVRNRRRFTDWITTVESGDGELGFNLAEADKTFDPGTPAIAVLEYLAKTMGVTIAPMPALAELASFILTHGIVAYGRARRGVADLLSKLRLTWWIEDGQLWTLREGDTLPLPPVVVSPASVPGAVRLLEEAERADDDGVAIRCQLSPSLRPGVRCVLASSELAGTYRIEQVTHLGDNRRGVFQSMAILRTQNPLGL